MSVDDEQTPDWLPSLGRFVCMAIGLLLAIVPAVMVMVGIAKHDQDIRAIAGLAAVPGWLWSVPFFISARRLARGEARGAALAASASRLAIVVGVNMLAIAVFAGPPVLLLIAVFLFGLGAVLIIGFRNLCAQLGGDI